MKLEDLYLQENKKHGTDCNSFTWGWGLRWAIEDETLPLEARDNFCARCEELYPELVELADRYPLRYRYPDAISWAWLLDLSVLQELAEELTEKY